MHGRRRAAGVPSGNRVCPQWADVYFVVEEVNYSTAFALQNGKQFAVTTGTAIDPSGTRIFFEKSETDGQNIITMYVLLRYTVLENSRDEIDATELKRIAETHRKILESEINNANYDYAEDGKLWRVKAKVIISTEQTIIREEDFEKSVRGIQKETEEYQSAHVAYRINRDRLGAIDNISITSKPVPVKVYNLRMVPAYNRWGDGHEFAYLLVHELIGHHLNNVDEDSPSNKEKMERDLKEPLPAYSIMSYAKTKEKKFYPWHWEAGFQDKYIGPKFRNDHTSSLDIKDEWFNAFDTQQEKENALRAIREIILAASRKANESPPASGGPHGRQ